MIETTPVKGWFSKMRLLWLHGASDANQFPGDESPVWTGNDPLGNLCGDASVKTKLSDGSAGYMTRSGAGHNRIIKIKQENVQRLPSPQGQSQVDLQAIPSDRQTP